MTPSKASQPKAHVAALSPAKAHPRAHSLFSDRPSGWAGQVLLLQRSVGNRTLSSLVSGQSPAKIQRLSVKAADLAPHITKSKIEKAVTFRDIERTLAAYEKAGSDLQQRAALLQQLDGLCTTWYNKHGNAKHSRDVARRGYIKMLLDGIPVELAALSRHDAQQLYLMNARAKAGSAGALQALTTTAKMGMKAPTTPKGQTAMEGLMAPHSLTEAELEAIRAYSADDYKYINPVVANSAGWLLGQKGKDQLEKTTSMLEDVSEDFLHHVRTRAKKAKKDKKEHGTVPATAIEGRARPVVEEAGLHAGVALQGLQKLPAFTKVAYRGERITPEQFKQKYAIGKIFPFNSFGSSSWDFDVAANYSHGLSGDNPPTKKQTVAVFQEISNSGGRDISELSLVPSEAEVLILPGSKFVVDCITPATAADFPNQVQKCIDEGKPVPKKWYKVQMSPVPTGKTRPSPPAESGSSGNIDGS
jgi:hypothetical protein